MKQADETRALARPEHCTPQAPAVWLPRRRPAHGCPAPSRRHALPRRPACSCAATPTTGCPRGSHYPHSIRGANWRAPPGFVDSSHRLPGRGTDQSLHREGGAETGRTNDGQRDRARPPRSAPGPGEVARRPLVPARYCAQTAVKSGRQVRSLSSRGRVGRSRDLGRQGG